MALTIWWVLNLRDEDLAGNNEQWQWCVVGKLLGVHLKFCA